MTRILGISGSLRAGSLNTALLRAAREVAGDGIEVHAATLHGIPLYDGDLEASEGEPAAVAALKHKLLAADGVLLVTPEYNSGIPGVFKNAIDWLSRPSPVGDIAAVFGGRPFAVAGASPGGFGTVLSQHHWLQVLKKLQADVWNGGSLTVSRAGEAFDADGRLVDDKVRGQLAAFVRGFAAYATR